MSMGRLLPIFLFQKLIIKVEHLHKSKNASFLKCKPIYGINTGQKEYKTGTECPTKDVRFMYIT